MLRKPETSIYSERRAECEAAVGHIIEGDDGQHVRVDNPYQAALEWWGREAADRLARDLWIKVAEFERLTEQAEETP